MTRAHLPLRVLVLTIIALLVAERVPGAARVDRTAAPIALGALGLSILGGRGRRWGRAMIGGLHALALVAAACAESGARAESVLAEPLAIAADSRALAGERPAAVEGDRLWLGRVIGCPRPAAGDRARAMLALARMRRGSAVPPGGSAAASAGPAWTRVGGRIEVELDHPAIPGEWWLIRGELWRPPGRRNPGGFDGEAAARRRGIAGMVRIPRPAAAERMAPAPPGWQRPDLLLAATVVRLRFAAHRRLMQELQAEAAGLAEAMALGARGSLSDRTQSDFRWLGWSHLVAVSGMNVGFVAALASALAGLVRLRRRGLWLVSVILLHAAVTGGEPPVMRATWMALLALLARARARSLTGGRALFLSAASCLASQPTWLRDPSFQLSFAALAGMSLGAPRLDWADPLGLVRGRTGRWVVVPIQAGIGAQLGCLPILATQFHWLSPWGVVTGPIVIPLASVFVSAILMALSLAGMWAPLGHLLLGGSALLGEGLLALSRLGAHHLAAPWPLATPGLPALGLFAVSATLAGVFGAAPRSKRRSVALTTALLGTGLSTVGIVAGLPPARGSPAAVEVIFLDVGQGDSALLLVHGPRQWIDCLGFPRAPQRALVCDCGDHPPGGFDCGAGIVAPALAALGVRAIDHALQSHGDRDHMGGLSGLATWLPVREVLWPAALPLPRALASDRSPLRAMSAGDTLRLAQGITIVVLHPAADFAGRGNNGSLTVSLRAFGERVLFLGDLEAVGEAALLTGARAESLTAQVVKVAHHGSATSSTDPLVQVVSPETAVVSVGARNRFGHPNSAVLARWQASGAQIVRTDQVGAVTLWLSPAGRELRTAIPPGPGSD